MHMPYDHPLSIWLYEKKYDSGMRECKDGWHDDMTLLLPWRCAVRRQGALCCWCYGLDLRGDANYPVH